MEVMYNGREHMKNNFSYVDFVKLCQVIKYFSQLDPNFGKEDIAFPLTPSLRSIKWRKILMNLNPVCLLLIEELTMTSQYIKKSVKTIFTQY